MVTSRAYVAGSWGESFCSPECWAPDLAKGFCSPSLLPASGSLSFVPLLCTCPHCTPSSSVQAYLLTPYPRSFCPSVCLCR